MFLPFSIIHISCGDIMPVMSLLAVFNVMIDLLSDRLSAVKCYGVPDIEFDSFLSNSMLHLSSTAIELRLTKLALKVTQVIRTQVRWA